MTAHEKNEKYSLLVRGRYRNRREKFGEWVVLLYIYIYIYIKVNNNKQ